MANPAKAHRNDLCPCGSKKKYKKCCAQKASTNSGTLMLILVGLLVVAGAAAVVTSFTADRSHVGSPSGVWSPEHGHYH